MITRSISPPSLLAQWPNAKLVAIAAVLACGCYLLGTVVYSYLFSPLRKVPGPFLARFTRFWEFSAVATGRHDDVLVNLHAKYGPIVRISPNKYSCNDPADTKVIYAPGSGFTKTKFYKAFGDPNRPSIFNTQDEKYHADAKRKVGALYSVSTLAHYEPSVDSMTEVLVSKLGQFAKDSKLIAVHNVMQYFAFDLIAQITLDRNFGMTDRQDDYQGAIANIHRVNWVASYLGLLPEVLEGFLRLTKFLKLKSPGLVVANFTRRNIATARDEDKSLHVKADSKAQPFVYKCLDLESQKKMSDGDIQNACGANLAAGSDTTGITLSAIFYYLHKNPASLRKLQAEIDAAVVEGRLSSPVTFQEAQCLPYLKAVIKEALRLHPAVGPLLPRYVRPGGVHLGGHFFPEGTEVGTSPLALHLNKSYHGDDCTEWKPERWFDPALQDDPDRKAAMSFTFGGGSRVCLGRNVSLLEIYKLVPEVLRRYEFVLETDETGQVVEAEMQTSFFAWLKFKCYVKERVFVDVSSEAKI